MKALCLVANFILSISTRRARSGRSTKNKSGLFKILPIIFLLFTNLVQAQEKTEDNEPQVIQVGSRKVSAKISGDEPTVCQRFISEYDFDEKTLKNPLKWAKVPEDKLADPVTYYGWVHYMDLDIDNDGKAERLYRTVGTIRGVNLNKDIEVIPVDSKIITDKLDVSELYKDAKYAVKAIGWQEIRRNYKPGLHDTYKVAAYSERSSIQPFVLDKSTYIYLANETESINERVYLIISVLNAGGHTSNREVCHIQFNK